MLKLIDRILSGIQDLVQSCPESAKAVDFMFSSTSHNFA